MKIILNSDETANNPAINNDDSIYNIYIANFEFSINVKGFGFAKNANCASKLPFYVGALVSFMYVCTM